MPFVALELLEGGGLDDRLAGNPQPGRQAAELMMTLARAVHVAHQAGIIHRDLKPTNVLYSSDGVPKITDFGLAKRIDSDAGHTQSGQIMGSPSYMAPEQARGQRKDRAGGRRLRPAARSSTRCSPAARRSRARPRSRRSARSSTTSRDAVASGPARAARPGDDLPEVPAQGAGAAIRVGRGPGRRPGALPRGEPIMARRTPTWERGAKWAKRRPIAAMFLAMIVAAVPIACSLATLECSGCRLRRTIARVPVFWG